MEIRRAAKLQSAIVKSNSRQIGHASLEFYRPCSGLFISSLKIIFETYSFTDVNNSLQPAPVEMCAPAISPDGYIRLRLSSIATLPLVHLYSDSDSEFLQELKTQTVSARIAGFSEWQSETSPAISIGWGWFIHSRSERMLLAPDPVRSNVMLIDAMGYDLGPRQTANLFFSWLDEFDWRDAVGGAIGKSFSSC